MAFSSGEENQHLVALQQQQQQAAAVAAQQQLQQQPPQVQQQPPPQQQPEYVPQDLTPEEVERRDKVRAAARERQRKHRLLVKQKRMRELGLDMGNEIIPGMEEVHYRATADGQYHQVLPPELQQIPPHAPMPQHEPPFPQGAPLGGQTFASTLLLSFSCAPLLKQHLLRTLGMSNEELASLEPIIAEAWDRWDHQRRIHYAEQVAKNGGQPPGVPPPYGVDLSQHDPQAATLHPFPHPNGPGPADPNQAVNDFRARFHRSIIAPTPFRTTFGDSQTASTTTPSSGSGSAPADAIDPHLATNANGNTSTTTKSENFAAMFDERLTTGIF
ncbi:hypothetical protein BDZ97DRAFT_1653622 [Flammula alnicola]|nr:hypothetical protein BDZ97DRAFT_1653622 [Flammula alnicola]